jgi:hypothetical protein
LEKELPTPLESSIKSLVLLKNMNLFIYSFFTPSGGVYKLVSKPVSDRGSLGFIGSPSFCEFAGEPQRKESYVDL